MIIVELAGGLGNQMFQYAIANTLARKADSEMKIDLSYFENYEWHPYCLDVFKISAGIANNDDVFRVKRAPNNMIEKMRKYFLNKQPNNIYAEDSLLFNEKFTKQQKNIYLKGYFQCAKYFIHNRAQILREFQFSKTPSETNKSIIEDINKFESVSLHIRRGNYINIPSVNKVHGVLNINYYSKAVEYLQKKLGTIKIYVFSDDIEWARINLKFNVSTMFVDINDDKTNFEDMRLMSLCKHNIIANSSFSWWGAWLNQNPRKIVIAPKQWFADSIKNEEAKDIVPDTWIKL
jgi:hypothetical protein